MPKQPPDPTTLKRESAGTYRTVDGRFTVQEASGRWLVLDAEQQDELGLPLTRGPFDTLAGARAAVTSARSGPAPASTLHERLAARSGSTPGRARTTAAGAAQGKAKAAPGANGAIGAKGASGARGASGPRRATAQAPEPPPIEIRRYHAGDGPAMRALWAAVGFRSMGDDDDSLDRMAERNPGLVLVATEGDRIVGTALGGWDGRRGWIYHLATASDRRRQGLGQRMVQEVERKLRQLGCPKVNVIVRDENPDGAAFWEALGYALPPSRAFGKEL
ncbi:MAG TPA: GNAT family N-acetyltransferase [Candidatus Limnocylindrales bacterium]